MISISRYKKSRVLAGLYNAAKVQGLGFLQADDRIMSDDEADKILIESEQDGFRFDYLKGRVLKVNLSGDEFDPRLYDRDNGDGVADRVIGKLVID